jgi:Ca-activated chloride channel family protein
MRTVVRATAAQRLRLSALCILLASFAAMPVVAARAARAQVAKGGRLHTDVNLVTLAVSVQDATGRPVTGLPREAFTIFDEGKQQEVAVFESETQTPLDLALMIDTSLSALKELEFERLAAMRFIKSVARPQDALAVYAISEEITRLTPYTSRAETLDAGLKHLSPGAGTSLYDAVCLSSGELERRPAGRRRVVVLVTDAGETTSRSKFEDARHAALEAEILLYTIVIRAVKNDSFRNLAGEHALATITDSTGGAMFWADDASQLDPYYTEIDRELRTQYLLAFYPKPEPPKRSIRHIEVRVEAGEVAAIPLRIRHRRLYLTEGATD